MVWFDSVLLDDIDDELDSSCHTFLHSNGYTNVSICNCKHGLEHCKEENNEVNSS